MTAICPGSGPSAPKSWVPAAFLVPSGAAANYIGNAGGLWASIIAAAIGVKVYDAVGQCVHDPPGWPANVTDDEMFAIALNQIGTPEWTSAVAKGNQMLDNVLWYLLCECTGAATPAQPAFPPAPAGAPTPGPQLTSPTSRLCITTAPPVLGNPARPETTQGARDVSAQLLPYIGAGSLVPGGAGFNTIQYVAPSPSPVAARVVVDSPGGAAQDLSFWYDAFPPLGTAGGLSVETNQGGSGAHVDSGVVQLAPFSHWAITIAQRGTVAIAQTGTFCVETYGPATPAGIDCCPPDPNTTAMLQTIVGLLTPLQRYSRPFAFITGASHSGVTGSGSTAIPRCVGVDVQVTAGVAGHPQSGGEPPYIYDLGWVAIASGGAMLEERRLSQEHFRWVPTSMPLADHFNFFLTPGTTITWTELYAEP